ncbi:hypothetical protein GQ53DRAFT_772394 [Thozetella sp. PMI_491]|nr:hypothetical protein GQ53DRAFT_772394 [Thozetella sp. PMI_491]
MRASTLSLAALAAPLVSAIAFTSPAENSTVTKGAEYELTWSSVDTDPSVFSIYLVNFVDWPPYYTPLALDIETGLGAYTVRVPCEAATSYGFQFNAINGTNVYVIYAQTPKFFIDGDACTDPPSSTCAAATVTVTVSTTLSSASATSTSYSASGNGTATYSRTSASSTATWSSNPPADHTTTSHHHPKPTSGGKCPDTIGWGSSGYSHPVTLTQAPTPPGAASTDYASTEVVYTTVYQEWQGQCHC